MEDCDRNANLNDGERNNNNIEVREECQFEEGEEMNGGQVDDLFVEEVFKITFESEEAVESFYSIYSRCARFGIRRFDRKLNNDGSVIYRKQVCHRE